MVAEVENKKTVPLCDVYTMKQEEFSSLVDQLVHGIANKALRILYILSVAREQKSVDRKPKSNQSLFQDPSDLETLEERVTLAGRKMPPTEQQKESVEDLLGISMKLLPGGVKSSSAEVQNDIDSYKKAGVILKSRIYKLEKIICRILENGSNIKLSEDKIKLLIKYGEILGKVRATLEADIQKMDAIERPTPSQENLCRAGWIALAGFLLAAGLAAFILLFVLTVEFNSLVAPAFIPVSTVVGCLAIPILVSLDNSPGLPGSIGFWNPKQRREMDNIMSTNRDLKEADARSLLEQATPILERAAREQECAAREQQSIVVGIPVVSEYS